MSLAAERQLRAERDALRKENAGLRASLARAETEKRMLEVARDIATRSAIVVWPRRPHDP